MLVRIISLVIFAFLVDLLIFRELRTKTILKWLHLFFSSGYILLIILFGLIIGYPGENPDKYRSYLYLFDIAFLLYGPKTIVVLTIVLSKLYRLVLGLPRYKKSLKYWQNIGLLFSIIFFSLIFYGIFFGKADFRVRQVDIAFDNLPAQFDGLRIVQISDLHLGNWYHDSEVRRGLGLVNQQRADIIVITGDLINISGSEVNPYIRDLSELKAPMGKYFILGNHDIGDFTRFGNEDYYQVNSKALTQVLTQCGFMLMRNSHVILSHKGDSLALMGVDNWSTWKFRKLGQLDQAIAGSENYPFHILLTHDPSHWKGQAVGKKIDLTLSGHTHGMQVGINTSWLQWSPLSFKYPEWLGIYKEGKQILYVNPGFGFVGFSGRIGMQPEVTVLVLHRK